MGATGIGQIEQFRGLVKGFAGGIIHRLTQQGVTAEAVHPNQLAVSAADQQGDKGIAGRLIRQHGGQQMALHVVHAEAWDAQAEGHGPGHRGTHHQCPHQTGARRVGNGIEVGLVQTGLRQDLGGQGQGFANMVPGRQFRHHAAVFGVHFHLAVQALRQQAPVGVIDRDTGLVATGFNPQNLQRAFSKAVRGGKLTR